MAEVVIVETPERAGELVAEAILEQVGRRPDSVLGFATGSTPLVVYRALAAALERGDPRAVALSGIRGFALDEYVGLPAGHPESYAEVIRREVCDPLGIPVDRVAVPNGSLDGIETAGERYDRAIAEAGGVDLQILGIGTDGHIGFNEPGSSFASRTRVKTLTEQTRRDNARFFASPDEVPRHCLTQGLGTILEARHLVLLAFGAGKAEAVAAAVEGPLTASLPGSAVQLHPRATIVVDEAAAAGLEHAGYYRYTYENKPSWQRI
ncbi:glucosamine-6-phosphate deaminase [Amnibacterium flavum]|uniref:Glucosamine-6-phosphate deaminase n=1 Tax=Amnibacterium flavum TaxID=2173173 RepID=A0A2V1HVI9_9MICO|nr:glucosamine-6-phosphate deaminase [Amnibacterium flavum]PVZ95020.1 glucosamine-6-phosphate deaminase [Amnibacterium flavum]